MFRAADVIVQYVVNELNRKMSLYSISIAMLLSSSRSGRYFTTNFPFPLGRILCLPVGTVSFVTVSCYLEEFCHLGLTPCPIYLSVCPSVRPSMYPSIYCCCFHLDHRASVKHFFHFSFLILVGTTPSTRDRPVARPLPTQGNTSTV
jgi:hypothetical protein